MNGQLTFDEAQHAYYLDGQSIPSVTSILKPVAGYEGIPLDIMNAAAEFGTFVHLACELDDKGELAESTVDHRVMPYLQAWRRFCKAHDVQWQMIEARIFNPTLRYAGTLDRFGLVEGIPTIVDIKTTFRLMPAVGPQLAAYEHALPPDIGPVRRMAVQIQDNGEYLAHVYTDPTDWPVFCSLLTLHNWTRQHRTTLNLK